jgi:iron(III) transport system substrate-binding protein
MDRGDRWIKLREGVRWQLRAWLESWRALDTGKKILIAGGLSAVAALSLTLAIWSFAKGSIEEEAAGGEVVLYTSSDMHIAQPIIKAFTEKTGIEVRIVGDTEATKTTGLVERLIAERETPRADVWWSNEALGSIALARDSILAPSLTKAEGDFKGGWPKELRAADKTWYGFGQRARVIAYNTNRVTKANAPTRLRDLLASQYSSRVGMARPQFGTTRTHIAAIVALHGQEEAREFLTKLRDHGVRLYEGNSAVVQALSTGEIDVGLTDTDDVVAAQRNTWPVAMSFEGVDKPDPRRAAQAGLKAVGTIVIPNTVGTVRGGPHPNEALRLLNYLLSADVERALAQSDSANMPIREALAKELKIQMPEHVADVTMEAVAEALPYADKLIAELFPIDPAGGR